MSKERVHTERCKPNNAEVIRSMTDEELAEWAAETESKAYARLGWSSNKEQFVNDWLEWLKQEAKT